MTRSTRVLMAVLGLVALAVTGGGAAAGTAAKGKGPDPAKIQKLKSEARGSVAISSNETTEYVAFVRAGRNGDLLPTSTGTSPAGKANDFIAEYGDILGLGAGSGLVRTDTAIDRQGAVHLSYKQVYKGLPVFGASVKAHVDAQGDLTAVNGTVVPVADLSTSPRLSAGDAAARAIDAVASEPTRGEEGLPAFGTAGDLRAESTELLVYRTGLIRGGTGIDQLAYRVDVTNGADIREVVIVQANAGKVINRYSLVTDALHRVVYEQNLNNKVWEEGDAFPGALNLDQQNIVKFSEDSYRHFFNAFGRDSYDGAGAFMQTVNNDPRINCPNANWNGITTNYCNGVTSDDVVAHEWGHAYTQFTHNLIYQWQPGALNESYSDIWGETVDAINGEGTDAPSPVRTVGNCSSFSRAAPGLFINSPASIAGECPAGGAQFGPALTGTGTTGDVVLANDGVAGDVNDGCEAITNGAALAGKIALINRGTCGFVVKVKNAQNAGAIAAIIANVIAGQAPATMAGVDPTITIPSVSTTLDKGNLMKGELALGNAVNATMKDKAGTREASYKWLMGEDSTAFGGAIRDMWNPRCLSDPGKVTDAEYQCSVDDQGGVHTNSGVPNHGYALLVDGGTFNGRTVSGLGLTKAAHIYWRAQSAYQTEGSKFPDHADALEASCTDLIGVNLTSLSTGAPAGPSGQAISAADCTQVTQMIAAVELRTDPKQQCNFQPLLKPGEPSLCEGQKNPPVVYEENFEDGLAGWSVSNQGVYAGWPGLDWAAKSTLPGGRAGTAAFGADPDIGNCDQGPGDVSGVMRLTSPTIALPNAEILSPRLSFRHYVATEANFDGGNLKISVNGGAFELVPASAFIFNAYNTTLTTAAGGNTSPLAGQPAYSGTDGGEVFGSWGLTQVNLAALGIEPGDTIQLRFDMGMDGCAGIDGWYVDDVKVQACNTKKADKAKKD